MCDLSTPFTLRVPSPKGMLRDRRGPTAGTMCFAIGGYLPPRGCFAIGGDASRSARGGRPSLEYAIFKVLKKKRQGFPTDAPYRAMIIEQLY